MSEKTEIDSVEESSNQNTKQAKSKRKSNKRPIVVQSLMALLTVGVWNRFIPRKKGTSGTWGLTVILLSILSAALIGERFFKPEINSHLKEQLQTETDILPEKWAFESGAVSAAPDTANIAAGKVQVLKAQLDSMAETLEEKDRVIESLKESLAKKPKIVEIENETIVEITPEILLMSYEEVESSVGCTSLYSQQKRVDVFEEKYKDKWVRWTGKISSVSNDSATLNGFSGGGFEVKFKEAGVGYDLMVNDEMSVTFKLTEQGSCDSAFKGVNAQF